MKPILTLLALTVTTTLTFAQIEGSYSIDESEAGGPNPIVPQVPEEKTSPNNYVHELEKTPPSQIIDLATKTISNNPDQIDQLLTPTQKFLLHHDEEDLIPQIAARLSENLPESRGEILTSIFKTTGKREPQTAIRSLQAILTSVSSTSDKEDIVEAAQNLSKGNPLLTNEVNHVGVQLGILSE